MPCRATVFSVRKKKKDSFWAPQNVWHLVIQARWSNLSHSQHPSYSNQLQQPIYLNHQSPCLSLQEQESRMPYTAGYTPSPPQFWIKSTVQCNHFRKCSCWTHVYFFPLPWNKFILHLGMLLKKPVQQVMPIVAKLLCKTLKLHRWNQTTM